VNTAYRNHVVALGGPPVRPVALEKVRFLKPVYPGDRVRFDLTIEPVDGQFRCAAWASVDSERVAEIRLRYPDANGGAR
jgi:acyl dehydratase